MRPGLGLAARLSGRARLDPHPRLGDRSDKCGAGPEVAQVREEPRILGAAGIRGTTERHVVGTAGARNALPSARLCLFLTARRVIGS